MMNLNIQQFGGRGASSSNNRSISYLYDVQETENGYKGKGSELLKFIKEEEKDSGVIISASIKKTLKENPNNTYTFDGEKIKKQTKISTFTGSKNLDKALENGYSFYRGEDLNSSGRNYKEVATRLKAEGYKVRVFEDTTRVRGLHNYTVLYKRK